MQKAILGGIRAALLTQGSATKAELARRLEISFPTVSKFLARMEKDGELLPLGMDDSSGGRRAMRYAYNPAHMLGLAVFLERNATSYTIFDASGEIRERGEAPGVLGEDVRRLAAHLDEIVARHPRIRAMAIGVPGAVDDGRIIHIPDYERYREVDLRGALQERFGLPVVVENDMNAAVLGYSRRLGSSRRSSLVYLLFGQNGPGAGILINGDVVRGSTSFSGEITFVPLYDRLTLQEALARSREADPGELGAEAVDAASRLIAAFAAILNPREVVFSRDEASDELLVRIARRSADYVPEAHLPKLSASDWPQDYLDGLQHLALQAMIETAGG
ncbi:ROK family protein [Cohnella sp. REN36]|nr:ROK family protein [Cohnella sp. REN36]MCC3372543.1 ROK family protein [Cohnella sp. REN36]